MAFNFNWAPLSGDPSFYKRAEELLTDAMNKNEKPPIIVDDIIVTELNLGEVPPDLEVVEISDIGMDRFRGTFKMSYSGNAYITIKTRVQTNPLNTYLLTRPSFASPQPLAAAAGLTIPLQITLSDFKLSAIIILVFSRQKGLTIVFRNDPLESLKVSSTFDSIPFIANYLQQVIERQLRTLFMDELPAIIHRMSLRLWVPEHKALEERALNTNKSTDETEPVIDPLAQPPQDPVDMKGNILSPAEVAALSLDSHIETQTLFSQKNLLRFATLKDSNRTLSLFTPNIRDAVFRAWTGPLERDEISAFQSRTSTPAISRTHSYSGSLSSTYTFDHAGPVRPALHSFPSQGHGISGGLGTSRSKLTTRKRKKRVVNLRKQPESEEMEAVVEDGSTITDSASVTESMSDVASVFSAPPIMARSARTASSERHTFLDPTTPPTSPGSHRQSGFDGGKEVLPTTPGRGRFDPVSRPPRTDVGAALEDQEDDFGTGTRRGTGTIRRRHRRVIDMHSSSEGNNNTGAEAEAEAETGRVIDTNQQTPRASRHNPPDWRRQTSLSSMNSSPPQVHAQSQTAQCPWPSSSSPSSPRPTSDPKSSIDTGRLGAGPSSSSSSLNKPAQLQPQARPPPPPPPQLPNFLSFIADPSNSSSIAERAWMVKMANEVARRYDEERGKGHFDQRANANVNTLRTTATGDDSHQQEQPPPPAYSY